MGYYEILDGVLGHRPENQQNWAGGKWPVTWFTSVTMVPHQTGANTGLFASQHLGSKNTELLWWKGGSTIVDDSSTTVKN